jgi:hypothetical protein
MLDRLFPRQVDNRFEGHRSALWLMGLLVALKLVVSLNSIFNTASVAEGADGIPLDSFGAAAAREVVTLFALTALGQLALGLVALAALIRWRALVPFLYLLSLGEMVARRLIVATGAGPRPEAGAIAALVTWGVLALLALGLLLSLIPTHGGRRRQAKMEEA